MKDRRLPVVAIAMTFLVAATTIASSLSAIPTDSESRRAQPPADCQISIGAINSGRLPLTLDLSRSGYRNTTGDELHFNTTGNNFRTLAPTTTSITFVTTRVRGACGTPRQYRFLFRNAAGDERVVLFPPPPAPFFPGNALMLGDIHARF